MYFNLSIVCPLVADEEGGRNGTPVGVPPLRREQVLVQPATDRDTHFPLGKKVKSKITPSFFRLFLQKPNMA
jgi:hypothetical protein